MYHYQANERLREGERARENQQRNQNIIQIYHYQANKS